VIAGSTRASPEPTIPPTEYPMRRQSHPLDPIPSNTGGGQAGGARNREVVNHTWTPLAFRQAATSWVKL
jgi:hypothetical protein